jgi:hypothetical protein
LPAPVFNITKLFYFIFRERSMLVEIRAWNPCDPNPNQVAKKYYAMMLDTNVEFDEWGNAINRSNDDYARMLWDGSVFYMSYDFCIRIEDERYIIEENTV